MLSVSQVLKISETSGTVAAGDHHALGLPGGQRAYIRNPLHHSDHADAYQARSGPRRLIPSRPPAEPCRAPPRQPCRPIMVVTPAGRFSTNMR